jgi:hypothetical protein
MSSAVVAGLNAVRRSSTHNLWPVATFGKMSG